MRKFKRLRYRMLDLEMTQGELARKAGISEATITERMQGRHPFTLREVSAICKALDIPFSDIPEVFRDGLKSA